MITFKPLSKNPGALHPLALPSTGEQQRRVDAEETPRTMTLAVAIISSPRASAGALARDADGSQW